MSFATSHMYIHPGALFRHLLAAGVLDPEDKPPQTDFQEVKQMPGGPKLPEGYPFSEWFRFAAISQSICSCVMPHHVCEVVICKVCIRLLHTPLCLSLCLLYTCPLQEVYPPRPPDDGNRRCTGMLRPDTGGGGLDACTMTCVHPFTCGTYITNTNTPVVCR